MARYTDSVCKLCRRERQKLFLKGQKCYTEKCPIEIRNYPPGQHGNSRRAKVSEYGIQLREKQKIKRLYGLLETQFRNYFENANKAQRYYRREPCQNSWKADWIMLYTRLDLLLPENKQDNLLDTDMLLLTISLLIFLLIFLSAGDIIKIKEKSKKLDAIHNSLKKS